MAIRREWGTPSSFNPSPWTFEGVNELLAKARELGQPIGDKEMVNLAGNWAKGNPSEAIRWASELPDHVRIEAAEEAVIRWFKNEPIDAAAYVKSLPEGEFRSHSVNRVVSEWLDADPEPAIKWVNQLPRGFDKDIGRREVAMNFRFRNPQRSFAQANAIDNPVLREEALEYTFQSWLRKDPTPPNSDCPKPMCPMK